MPLEPFELVEKEYLLIEHWMKNDANLVAGFSTRKGGVSQNPYTSLNVGLHVQDEKADVINNRKILASKLQFPLENWVVGEQVHGALIEKVTNDHKGSGAFDLANTMKGVDGLYTTEKGVLLVSLYADCTPLYFYAKENHIVGLAHAGWRGTVQGIGQEMIRMWQEKEQIPLKNIFVTIGPSISKEKYEVDDYVIEQVNPLLNKEDELPYEKIATNKYLLDLKYLNYLLLLKAGLQPEQIHMSKYCTATDKEMFYSHRHENGRTGRMMSFIGFRTD